tara:strand:- start:1126 stop:3174 length:2049 start_codon:yes stop_codon:yes gene_type:complete
MAISRIYEVKNYYGTEADLPATLPNGDTYSTTDTGKIFRYDVQKLPQQINGGGSSSGVSDYNDLTNKPTLFDGDYSSLANQPTLFDGDYSSLTNVPASFDGDYGSLVNQPTLFDGEYSSLTNIPAQLGTEIVSGVPTIINTAFAEQDFSNWPLSGNASGSNFNINSNWSLAPVAATAHVDSAGYAMTQIIDDQTGSGFGAFTMRGIDITSLLAQGETKTVTFEILKSTLVKPMMVIVGNNDGANWGGQSYFEMLSTGVARVGSNQGLIGTPVVVSKSLTWEVTFDIIRPSDATTVHLGLVTTTKLDDSTGAFNAPQTGTIDVSPFRVKSTVSVDTTVLSDTPIKKIKPNVLTNTIRTNDVAFVIVMGQSNAAGTNGTAPVAADCPDVYVMGEGAYTFKSYDNINNNVFGDLHADKSNPQTEIAREWQIRKNADPTNVPDLYIINISRGGTGFDYSFSTNSQWDPFLRKNGAPFYALPEEGTVLVASSLFYTAQKAIKEALLQFAKNGQRASHVGTIWNQWENDALTQTAADRYPANLLIVRKMVDDALGIKDADFYTWRPLSLGTTYAATIVQHQTQFDEFIKDNNNTFLIDARDFANYDGVGNRMGVFTNDFVHYDQTSQENGAKFFLDNSWFASDGRRARPVAASMDQIVSNIQLSVDGSLFETKVTNGGAYSTTELTSI